MTVTPINVAIRVAGMLINDVDNKLRLPDVYSIKALSMSDGGTTQSELMVSRSKKSGVIFLKKNLSQYYSNLPTAPIISFFYSFGPISDRPSCWMDGFGMPIDKLPAWAERLLNRSVKSWEGAEYILMGRL